MRRLAHLWLLVAALAAAAPAHGYVKPNDPAWPAQSAQRLMRVADLWSYTVGDPSVVIGVVDTGVNPNLPDLFGKLQSGVNLFDNSVDFYDSFGHGSVVTTELAARGNNGEAMAGYCWECRVIPIKVTGPGLSSTPGDGLVAAGIRWAVDHGARIVNVSFNSDDPDAGMAAAIANAQARGAIVVASAGNTGRDEPTYPASYPGVISVAGTDDSDALLSFSTRGGWVQLAAPGCQVTTVPSDVYGVICGTSVTAPAVAGIIGLLLSLDPTLTQSEMLSALRSTAVPVAGNGGGRVDAYAAAAALGLVPKKPTKLETLPASLLPLKSNDKIAKRPASKVRKPAASAFDSEARILLGTVKTHRRYSLRLGKGRIRITFTSAQASECTLSLASISRVLIGARTERDQMVLSTNVAGGFYKVDLTCQTGRPKPYSLVVTAMFPRLG